MPSENRQSETRKSGPRRPAAVKRKDNRLIFTKSVDPYAHRQFMWCLSDCLERGYQDLILDLSLCQHAFPKGVLPVIAGVDTLRRNGPDVSAILPANDDLHRLFANTTHFKRGLRLPRIPQQTLLSRGSAAAGKLLAMLRN